MTTTYIDVYRAKDGWRWRGWRGARIVADGGQAYVRRSGALRAAMAMTATRMAIRRTGEQPAKKKAAK